MSVKTTINRFTLDSLTVFRASGLATVAASNGSTNPLTLDELSAYWNAGDNANLFEFAIRAQAESIGAASGSPTVVFTVQVDVSTAFSTAVTIATSPTLTAAGTVVLAVDREAILAAQATLGATGPLYLQVYMTLAGGATTPAVAWNAYPAPFAG